jgi:hypothetical protein
MYDITTSTAVSEGDNSNSIMAEKIFDLRHFTLAYSLYAIDNVELSEILEDNDDFETRLSLIEEMSDNVIQELYKFFEDEIRIKDYNNDNGKELIGDIKK